MKIALYSTIFRGLFYFFSYHSTLLLLTFMLEGLELEIPPNSS